MSDDKSNDPNTTKQVIHLSDAANDSGKDMHQGAKCIIRNMIKKNMSLDQISQSSGLSIGELISLQQEFSETD